MNRKLHNTILAFSISGVMLFVGLVVAEPVLPPVDLDAGWGHPAAVIEGEDADSAEPAPARAETSASRTAVPGEAVAFAAGVVALSITEAALSAALADLDAGAAGKEDTIEQAGGRKDAPAQRKARASRDLLAMPYFSFARGSRGSRS